MGKRQSNQKGGGVMHVQVTVREWDTIIAALRLWQKPQAHIADEDGMLADLAEEHGEALSDQDIDAMIYRLNTQPQTR
jgi:hypothetical protein